METLCLNRQPPATAAVSGKKETDMRILIQGNQVPEFQATKCPVAPCATKGQRWLCSFKDSESAFLSWLMKSRSSLVTGLQL